MTAKIKQLITSSEGKTLEFKRDLSSPRPVLKTLVAFANTAGGRLIVGVDDDRRVVGVADPLDEEERICSLIADSIAPRLVPNVELMTVEGKTVVVVEVFLPGMTIEDMKQGISKIRNSVIARIFRELDLIEQWGSGVRRVFKEAEELGLPELQIVEIGMRMRFIVPLAEPNKIKSNAKQTVGDDTFPPKSGESLAIKPTQSPTHSPTHSDDPVIRLIKMLLQGPLSSGELRKQLNLKHRPTFRKNYLHPALKEGCIEMTIPEKPNSRLQKYRLTPRGKAVIDAQTSEGTDGKEKKNSDHESHPG